MTRLSIRHAEAGDAETIHAAIRAMAEGLGTAAKIASSVEDIRRHGFGDSPAFTALIAESDGRFAGLCLFFPSFSTWRGERGVYVQDLFVAPAFRGQGVAERLLRRLAAMTRRSGGRYIRLSVDADNVAAQRFYGKAGFRHADDERIFVALGDAFQALAERDDE